MEVRPDGELVMRVEPLDLADENPIPDEILGC